MEVLGTGFRVGGLVSGQKQNPRVERILNRMKNTTQKSQFKIKKRKERAFVSLHLPLFVSLV